jgi:hypothetical protein
MSLGRVFCVSVLAAITLSSIGCGVREQWPTRRFAREYKPTDEGPVVFAPDVQQSTYNRTAMSGLPAHVQVTFPPRASRRRDHPSRAGADRRWPDALSRGVHGRRRTRIGDVPAPAEVN